MWQDAGWTRDQSRYQLERIEESGSQPGQPFIVQEHHVALVGVDVLGAVVESGARYVQQHGDGA